MHAFRSITKGFLQFSLVCTTFGISTAFAGVAAVSPASISVVASETDSTFFMVFFFDSKALSPNRTFNEIALRLCDQKTNQCLTDWINYSKDREVIIDNEFGENVLVSDSKIVKALIKSIPHLVLQLSINKKSVPDGTFHATHQADLGILCKSKPSTFIDVDTEQSLCP